MVAAHQVHHPADEVRRAAGPGLLHRLLQRFAGRLPADADAGGRGLEIGRVQQRLGKARLQRRQTERLAGPGRQIAGAGRRETEHGDATGGGVERGAAGLRQGPAGGGFTRARAGRQGRAIGALDQAGGLTVALGQPHQPAKGGQIGLCAKPLRKDLVGQGKLPAGLDNGDADGRPGSDRGRAACGGQLGRLGEGRGQGFRVAVEGPGQRGPVFKDGLGRTPLSQPLPHDLGKAVLEFLQHRSASTRVPRPDACGL